MIHANFTALCFIETELLRIKVSHCGNSGFLPFCSADLDLDPMTFIYELYPYSCKVYRMCRDELPMSRLSKVIVLQTNRQTDRHTYTYIHTPSKLYNTSLRGWSKVSTENRENKTHLLQFSDVVQQRENDIAAIRRSFRSKYAKNAKTGALPDTPLGEVTALSRSL